MMHDAILLQHFDALQPGRKSLRHVLLPEPFRADTRGISLHGERPPAQVRQHHRRDRFVISGQLALGDPVVREQNLVGVGNHWSSRTTSRGTLSNRTPVSRGCRSLPCTVPSMNATFTTISGVTQCARSRGSPIAFVNGVFDTSSESSRRRRSSSSFVSNPVPIFPAKARSLPS